MPPVRYLHPDGVAQPPGRSILTTPQGGAVALDASLLGLWRDAAGRSLDELRRSAGHETLRNVLPEALACLAEATLLERQPPTSAAPIPCPTLPHAPRVRAVVVVSSGAELPWLDECLPSLAAQDHPLDEIVIVDNGGVLPARDRPASIRVVARRRRGTYAAALNDGVASADASYLLLLNADVRLHRSALRNLLARAVGDDRCAAVAPKLKFWRTPAFLNGIGNRIPDRGWGTDNAIGQLDLGQFDHWRDVPSGCLAVLLVNAAAFTDVGPFDGAYPAYYEDADWSYRARALGYAIGAAPAAEVLHVFGATWNEPGADSISHAKQAAAGASRLRFAWKIPSRRTRTSLLGSYLQEDLINVGACLKSRRHRLAAAAVLHGSAQFLAGLPGVVPLRRDLQRRRRVSDGELFVPEAGMPRSCLEASTPLLTADLVTEYYAPLMRAGKTRRLPELS